jgi:hypothetical protein
MAARLMPNLMDTDDDRSARILSAFWGSAPAEGTTATVLPLRPLARAIRHEMPASEENRP